MNPAISRAQVHHLAEQCSEAGDDFQATATRLLKQQRKLSKFFENNAQTLGLMPGQVALYMLAVSIRVLQHAGGRLYKVNASHIKAAELRVKDALAELMPVDDGFAARARAYTDRAQSHLLDEILWALYERPDEEAEQAHLEDGEKALVYIMLWTGIEALDMVWQPAKDWSPDDYQLPEGAEPPPAV